MVEQGADIAVLAWRASADIAAASAEMVGVFVGLRFVVGIGGFGFHGGQLDVVVADVAALRQQRQGFQCAASGVCWLAQEGELVEAAADFNLKCARQGVQIGIECAAQALHGGVVELFQPKVDGVGHAGFLVSLPVNQVGRQDI